MKILVVGVSPLPAILQQALTKRCLITTCSPKDNLLSIIATKEYDCLLIWSEQISYLTLKKIVKHLLARFPSLKILVCGQTYSSPARAMMLMLGVKDCIAGRICPDELIAKLALVCQNGQAEQKTIFTKEDFAFDFTQDLASYRGVPIPLNKKESLILGALLRRRNSVLTKQLLYNLVWSSASPPTSNSLEVYISSLRRKVEKPFGLKLIESVKGVGYRVRD